MFRPLLVVQAPCRCSIRLAFASVVQRAGEKSSRLVFGVPKGSSAAIRRCHDLCVPPGDTGGDLLPAGLGIFCLVFYNSDFEEIFHLL